MDNVKAWTGLTPKKSIRTAAGPDNWRRLDHDAANPRIEEKRRRTKKKKKKKKMMMKFKTSILADVTIHTLL